jgi:hypothetical protein
MMEESCNKINTNVEVAMKFGLRVKPLSVNVVPFHNTVL